MVNYLLGDILTHTISWRNMTKANSLSISKIICQSPVEKGFYPFHVEIYLCFCHCLLSWVDGKVGEEEGGSLGVRWVWCCLVYTLMGVELWRRPKQDGKKGRMDRPRVNHSVALFTYTSTHAHTHHPCLSPNRQGQRRRVDVSALRLPRLPWAALQGVPGQEDVVPL